MNLTAPAKKAWEKIPQTVRVRLLNNVYCVSCRGCTGIGNVSGTVERGDLILKGVCVKCGGEVARHIETSEME